MVDRLHRNDNGYKVITMERQRFVKPGRINKLTRLSPTHLVIDETNFWQGKRVNIQIVDTAKGIAVFVQANKV
jgi:hypothetical protein